MIEAQIGIVGRNSSRALAFEVAIGSWGAQDGHVVLAKEPTVEDLKKKTEKNDPQPNLL